MMNLHERTARIIAAALWCAMVLAAWSAGPAQAAAVDVTSIALREATAGVQVTITTSGPTRYQQVNVRPDWIVVDVLEAKMAVPRSTLPRGSGVVARIRVGQFEPRTARVVIELTRPFPVRLQTEPAGTAAVIDISSDGTGGPAAARAEPEWRAAGASARRSWPRSALATVTDVAVHSTPRGAQVVITASGPVRYVQRDVMPTWAVVDVQGVELAPGTRISKPGRDPVERVRVSRFGRGTVQVVAELSRPISVTVATSADRSTITLDVSTRPSALSQPVVIQSSSAPGLAGSASAQTPSRQVPAAAPPVPEGPAQTGSQIGPRRPAATEYLLGPDDVLEVTVWGYPDLTRVVTVRPDGLVAVPLAGTVSAAGRSVERLTQDLTRAFAKYIIRPQVTVIVKEFRKMRVSVLGHVAHPGTFALEPGGRILDALSMASGVTDDAALTQAQLVRVSGETRPLNLEGLLLQQDMSQNLALAPGDTIIIPEDTKNKFYVLGDVNRPGTYALKGDVTVLEALAIAGGPVMHGASTANSIHIVRRVGGSDVPVTASARSGDAQPIANGRGVLITKDLQKMYKGDLQQNETVRPGDVMVVPAPGAAALPTILSVIGTFLWGIRP